jgi:beta-carotene/zeaxanthin 4-ketolase
MGLIIAFIIILSWLFHQIYILLFGIVDLTNIIFYLHILLQAFLFTGLFITAHDAMHGTVVKNKRLNRAIGTISTFFYAGLSYSKLLKNHTYHHKYPASKSDPDFSDKSQNFFIWWLTFLFRYSSFSQIFLMAVFFNVLKIWIAEINIFLFWILPVFLSSIQLFYFGTYKPHKLPHSNEMTKHNSRTLNKNHLYAFLTCYFFGYHLEHHLNPGIPWWKLYKEK